MPKQTAIEWLLEQVPRIVNIASFDILEQAKAMEKEEIELSDEEIDNAVVKDYENVGDEKLFPNFTDKDIWQNGFYEGAKWYREQLKKSSPKTSDI